MSRFMNSDAASEKRRCSRQYNREQRDRGDRSDEIKEDKRTESRHQFCPCHGRRMSRCPAEFADVELFCDKGKFHREVVKPIADLKQGIVFANDVADCDELIPQLDFLRQTGGCTLKYQLRNSTASYDESEANPLILFGVSPKVSVMYLQYRYHIL